MPFNNQRKRDTLFLFNDNHEQSLEKNHTHFLWMDDVQYQSSSLKNQISIRSSASPDQRSYPKEIQRLDFVTCACQTHNSDHSISNILFDSNFIIYRLCSYYNH